MGGRAVEGTGLENRQRGNPFVGSNPTPSASYAPNQLITNEPIDGAKAYPSCSPSIRGARRADRRYVRLPRTKWVKRTRARLMDDHRLAANFKLGMALPDLVQLGAISSLA